jgi:hypothetical protein
MTVERRLFIRFVVSGIVVVQPDPEKSDTIDCELYDLSFNGAGLYSSKQLIPNTKVKYLIINRQLNVNIGGFAKVVYCNPLKYNNKDWFRIGMEFIDVERQQIQAILMQVRKKPKES